MLFRSDAVDQALQHVLSVKAKLGLTSKIVPIKRDPDKTPSDVLRSIVQANRQVNLLLERRFSPSDAFQQVTVAMGYCEKLLERFPKAETMPRAPSFKPNKQPGDVYGRLLKASDTIHAIIQASGLQSLELKHPKQALIEGVAPSDVYDIASLLVSELAYLHSQLPDPAPPRTVYFPGRKFPSDVYQRAGILERQLAELGRAIEKNPAWLRP